MKARCQSFILINNKLVYNCVLVLFQREQMFEAQEMFRTANKLSRPEKAIILGFMAGSRDNPYPDQGDIVQVSSLFF